MTTALSTGAVENVDWISAEGLDIPYSEYSGYDTNLHLMVRLRFRNFENALYSLIAIKLRPTLLVPKIINAK